jgi:class 3 adenylate cyclase
MSLSSRSFIKFSPTTDRRRLAALMFTDIVGYSAIFHRDESLAMRLLGEKCQIMREIVPQYGGKEIKTLGDGFFIEFLSVQEAVKCAYDIQSYLYQRNLGEVPDERFQVRIGIHLCDFIATDEDAFGNDVNISSRLEKIAPPGGICVSQQVVDQVCDKLDLRFTPLRSRHLKNIKRPVTSYSIDLPWLEVQRGSTFANRSVEFFASHVSLQKAGWTASRLILIPALIWMCASFFMPHEDLTGAATLRLLGEGLKGFLALNPLLAMVSFFGWFVHMHDRRLLYIGFSFVLASLSLVTLYPDFFGALSPSLAAALQIFAGGFIPLSFVALAACESQDGKTESLATISLVVFTAWGLTLNSGLPLEVLRVLVGTAAVVGSTYFVVRAQNYLKKNSQISGTDMRRAVYSICGTLVFVLANWNFVLFGKAEANHLLALFFPIVYPVAVILLTIKSHLGDTQVLHRHQRAGQVMQQIAQHVCSGDVYEEKLSNIQERLCHFLDAERSTIYLTDIDSTELRLKAQAIYGPTEKLKEVSIYIAPDQGLIGRVWKTRSPLMVNDLKTDSRLSDKERDRHHERKEYRTNSCLLCPLILGNEIVGVMTFSDKRNALGFTEEELKLVQFVAKDIALLSVNQRYSAMVDHFVSEKLNDFTKSA